MKLIDLYVAEVGRHLPRKQRLDIQNELRSALEDAVDDQARQQGKPPDDSLAADVLRRYGAPEKTAASYLPARYLIGPELFPAYANVVVIVAGAVILALAVAFGAELGTSPAMRANAGEALFQTLTQMWSAVFLGAAVVTVIFAIFEWTSSRVLPQPKAWDPSMLKDRPERDPYRVNPVELTFQIVATIAALLIFNFYPQWVGFYWLQDGHWQSVTMLAPAFFQYLPWLDLWWGLQIILNLIVLAQRRRQPLTHWLALGLDLVRTLIFFQLVLAPALVQLDAVTLSRLGAGALDARQIATANDGLNIGVRVGLGVAAALSAVDLARNVYRWLLSERVNPMGMRGNNS
jgi:hypothetical protein